MKDLDKWAAEAGRDIPVDRPDIVTDLVLPDLGELHSPPLEGAFILACKKVIGQTLRGEVKPLDLFEQRLREHLKAPQSVLIISL